MTTLEARDADITKVEIDAIANAANTKLMHGGEALRGCLMTARGVVRQPLWAFEHALAQPGN
jgi:O-acetyl-ADP-ribose deacetylase (regulator of RNase III)